MRGPAHSPGDESAVLPAHQGGAVAALPDERRVRAGLDDVALLENEDAIGVDDRRKAVRDDESRPAPHQRFQCRLNRLLRLRIEGRGRLVEKQNARVLERRTILRSNGRPESS